MHKSIRLSRDKNANIKLINIHEIYNRKQYTTLCIPSYIDAVSLAVNYMSNYFLSKFSKSFFKSVHIEGKNTLDDFIKFSDRQLLKKQRPALSIIHQLDVSFDRERLDMSYTDLDTYVKTCKSKDAFFADKKKGLYLGINFKQILLNFTFKIKVITRAEQLDLYNYMKTAFRVGLTKYEDIDLDFIVPEKFIKQLAKDAGFHIDSSGNIENPLEFLIYLNSHSALPFQYKMRNMSGKFQYFIRILDITTHMSQIECDIDDGEKIGNTWTNFGIELRTTLRFPMPKFYTYFSYEKHDNIEYEGYNGENICESVILSKVPTTNEKGWNQFLSTEYQEDYDKDIDIDLRELFTSNTDSINKVIEYCKKRYISPDIFIDIQVYDNMKPIKTNIDWTNMKLFAPAGRVDDISYIAIYINLQYLNETIINMKKEESR